MWTYETSVDWKEGKTGETRCEGKPAIEVATPPEFGGPEGVWSPEDLLTSAVATCIMTSALFFIGRAKIQLRTYKSTAVGTMEKTAEGLAITRIAIEVSIELDDLAQADATRKAVEQAEKTCPLSISLKCPVELTVNVS